MKYVCDACERLVEPRAAAPEAALALICSRCGEATLIAPPIPIRQAGAEASMGGEASRGGPAGEVAPALRLVPPEERCPKCTHPKAGESCPKCGLVFALYKPEPADGFQMAAPEFARLLAAAPAEIGKKLQWMSTEQLANVARLCRLHLAEHPADAKAKLLLEEIAQRSLAQVMALSAVPRQSSTAERGKLVVYAAMGIALLAVSSFVAYFMAQALK